MPKLKQCPDCEKEISKRAKTCPHCGAQNKKGSVIPYILFLFLFFVAIGSMSPKAPTVSPPAIPADSTAESPYILELISFRCYQQGRYTIIEGEIKNISNLIIKNVKALGEHRNKDGELLAADGALTEFNPLNPQQKSPFKTYSKFNPEMSKCSVSFKTISGSQIKTKNN